MSVFEAQALQFWCLGVKLGFWRDCERSSGGCGVGLERAFLDKEKAVYATPSVAVPCILAALTSPFYIFY